MKTITTTTNLYTIQELSKEAQEKAHMEYVQTQKYDYLEENLTELCYDLLKENNIIPEDKSIRVMYSLSNCQGDGVMFEGKMQYKSIYDIYIKQSGLYYHENSKTIEIHGTDGLGYYDNDNYDALYKEFNDIYVSICKKLEKEGYKQIDIDNSYQYFVDSCDANEYTFTIDGIMNNI